MLGKLRRRAWLQRSAVVASLEISKQADSKTIAGLSDQVRRPRDAKEQLTLNQSDGAAGEVAGGYSWTVLWAAVACVGGLLIGMYGKIVFLSAN